MNKLKDFKDHKALHVLQTKVLNDLQAAAIYRLWNSEYPEKLRYENRQQLDDYLSALHDQQHFFLADDQGLLHGWAFSFLREGQRWFAVIVSSRLHAQGYGTLLLNELKNSNAGLHGWVIDHANYKKQDGNPYLSPLGFYLKNNFTVQKEQRLETPKLSAVKIEWHKAAH